MRIAELVKEKKVEGIARYATNLRARRDTYAIDLKSVHIRRRY